mgnify:CR=1 FL=1
MQSQWTHACTKGGDGQHKYAYGNTYNASACTTPGSGRSQPTEVGSQSQCVGGFPGLFDMIGNVSEWEDGCDDDNDNYCDAAVTKLAGVIVSTCTATRVSSA